MLNRWQDILDEDSCFRFAEKIGWRMHKTKFHKTLLALKIFPSNDGFHFLHRTFNRNAGKFICKWFFGAVYRASSQFSGQTDSELIEKNRLFGNEMVDSGPAVLNGKDTDIFWGPMATLF